MHETGCRAFGVMRPVTLALSIGVDVFDGEALGPFCGTSHPQILRSPANGCEVLHAFLFEE